jgi:site-specific recombinase XerD
MTDQAFYRTIRDFLHVYLPKQRVCSVNTVTAYRHSINQFIDFVAKKKGCGLSDIGFDDLTYHNVIIFLDDIQSTRLPYKPRDKKPTIVCTKGVREICRHYIG